MHIEKWLVWGLIMAATIATAETNDFKVLSDTVNGVPPTDMMTSYLMNKVNASREQWLKEYEARTSTDAIQERAKNLRQRFLDEIGGFPERTPLNAQITGVIERDGYRVEKVIFESQPKFFVTALLFLPDPKRFTPPYPGILIPSGHAQPAKGHDEYQSMGASLAFHGMAALAYDPIEQGERMQILDADGKPRFWGTQAHTIEGAACILLGRNTAWFEIWDGMRAIDYLQSRPEIDPQRIGCTGNSGGGTQTSYLMALDDRIKAASPSCYVHHLPRQLDNASGDAEQNIHAQLVFGMDHADYVTMQAPMPILLCAATKDFFDIGATWETFRHAKRTYTRFGFPERVDILENDAEHNYNVVQRTGVLRWMARWLLKNDAPLEEPKIQLLTPEEYQCTPRGQVMLLDGARSVYDINTDYEKELAAKRQTLWANASKKQMLAKARRIAGVRSPQDLPEPRVQSTGQITRKGYRIEKLVLEPEEGIQLPALAFIPDKPARKNAVLYLNQAGKAADAGPGGPIEKLVENGALVLAVDLRGTGETAQTEQKEAGEIVGLEWKDFFRAYVLGLSYVGMRTEDILVCARYLAQRAETKAVHLHAVGNVAAPALHAAAFEPKLFESVTLNGMVESWSNVIAMRPTHNQLVNTVHGALTVYDLPNLASTLGNRLTIERPVDGMGKALTPKH